ncbi:nucleotidyltransferase-like protein [Bacillus niameyensis]|uniref:nucleotidyltransferase-like protein n=1 Tax=Bacillus niameyensis TaxID=1522308 RepID=UPI0007823BEB|nr:nucleotidyltransferase-like protein [Bacillus niameyensis]
MEEILKSICVEKEDSENTLGILVIEKKQQLSPSTNTFDFILLVIVRQRTDSTSIMHYQYNDKRIALHNVTEQQIKEWILFGSNNKIIEWIHEGEVLFDKNEFVLNLRNELRDFPFYDRKLKIGVEFAKLIRRYLNGKSFFETGQFLDAYNHMIHCLHHLARLAIIEKGFYPELTVWSQVKQMDPEIYKLYEELVNSEESIEKRLDLLFIASEFLIFSRTKIGAGHLLETLEMQTQWSIGELKSHPELHYYGVDLDLLVEYLIDKDFITVVEVPINTLGLSDRFYFKK